MEMMEKDYGFIVFPMLQKYLFVPVGGLFIVYYQKKGGMGEEVHIYVLFVI